MRVCADTGSEVRPHILPQMQRSEKKEKELKYTFVNEAGKEQTVLIPDDYIQKNCAALGISRREAIQMYLSDEGYISNEIVEELTAKAKANGAARVESGKKRKSPTRKPDYIKRAVIAALANRLELESISLGEPHTDTYVKCYAENVEIANIERIIAFSIGEDKYELTLSKKRKPKTQRSPEGLRIGSSPWWRFPFSREVGGAASLFFMRIILN